ncbi:hypothetical protein [Bradyrhizobium sp. USDA 4486]
MMGYRQILESAYQPGAYASRFDRLMSVLDRSRQANNCVSMTSQDERRRPYIEAFRPLPMRSASNWLTALNCAKRLVVGARRDRLDRDLYVSWTVRGGSSKRSSVVWPLWTVNIAPHFLR